MLGAVKVLTDYHFWQLVSQVVYVMHALEVKGPSSPRLLGGLYGLDTKSPNICDELYESGISYQF